MQKRINIIINLMIPHESSLAQIKQWLAALEIDPDTTASVTRPDFPLTDFTAKYLKSITAIAAMLLQTGRLPVFDEIQTRIIQNNKENPGIHQVKMSFALIDQIPHSIYQITARSAAECIQWMASNPPVAGNLEKIFKEISERILPALWKMIPSGKSTIPVLRSAHQRGIPFIHLGSGIYQLGWGSKGRKIDRSCVEFDAAIGAKITQNKITTANILRIAGLPAPTHSIASSPDQALSAARQIGFPVVTKPADRERGEGVSIDIDSAEALQRGFTAAENISPSKQVIIEKQVAGVCHRLFIASGKLLYAVQRNPISIKGDGIRTIRQIVDDQVSAEARRPPWNRSELSAIDQDSIAALKRIGLTPESVAPADTIIPLRRIESTQWGGTDVDVTRTIHPENTRIAIQAAKLLNLHVAGVDLISPDISKPWHENGAIINEVNFSPLLGGAEISRSYIGRFLSDFIEGDGKIPIEAFDDLDSAKHRQIEYKKNGSRCFLSTAHETFDPDGQSLRMPFQDVNSRIWALIMRNDVDAIVFTQSKQKIATN